MLWISYRSFSFHHAMWFCPVERIAARFLPHSKRLDNMEAVGAIFFPFVFRFLAYLLSCILFLFALRYFVDYAPLLRAVCKFRYSLLSCPYLLPVFTCLLV